MAAAAPTITSAVWVEERWREEKFSSERKKEKGRDKEEVGEFLEVTHTSADFSLTRT